MRTLLIEASQTTQVALKLAFIIAFAMLTSLMLKRLLNRVKRAGHLTDAMAARVHNIRRWTVMIAAILLGLQTTGLFENAWALISAVLAAIAIGFFAAWSLLSNTTSALIILVFRPFRVGDQIELIEPTNGTQFGGRVEDMNLMFTTLSVTTEDHAVPSLLHIPNNLFMQKLVRAFPPSTRLPSDTFFHDSLMGIEPAPAPPDDAAMAQRASNAKQNE